MTRVPAFLRGFFTQHLEMKFLALVIGLVIFYSRERQETAERTVQVDLMTVGEELLGDLVRVSPLPPKIEIAVRGPAGQVANLRADQVGPVAISMRDAVATGRVELRREMFNLPEGVRMLWASPAVLEFRFEKRAERVVPVVPDLGRPDRDVVIDPARTVVRPATVRLVGAESAVLAIEDVRTDPVDLAGWDSGTLVRDVRLRLLDTSRVQASAESARVQVTLRPDVIESERTGIPVEIVKGTDFGPEGTLVYGAAGLRVTAVVRGPRSVIESLDSADIRLFARVTPEAFADPDGDGVRTADVTIEAERRAERWSVVRIVPPTIAMSWSSAPASAPAGTPGGDAAQTAPQGGHSERVAGER